jgi:16S rRNA (uracil1498-N3)-methyltransferase
VRTTRVFVTPAEIEAPSTELTGQNFRHLARVLRVEAGSTVLLLDNSGRARESIVTEVTSNAVVLHNNEFVELDTEPNVEVTILQAIGRGDRFDEVLQHCTEAGASRFVPIVSIRSMVEIPPDRIPDRLDRWRKIIRGAAEQSMRTRLPEITPPLPWHLALESEVRGPLLMLHTVGSRKAIADTDLTDATSVTVAVGPEGGWSGDEVELAIEAGATPVTLGPRVLRTETAALVAVTQLLFQLDRRR